MESNLGQCVNDLRSTSDRTDSRDRKRSQVLCVSLPSSAPAPSSTLDPMQLLVFKTAGAKQGLLPMHARVPAHRTTQDLYGVHVKPFPIPFPNPHPPPVESIQKTRMCYAAFCMATILSASTEYSVSPGSTFTLTYTREGGR